jgi:AsmA protein
VTVERLRGNIAGGTISGKARAELNRKPIAYSGNIDIDQTRAENFLSAFFPAAADTIFGSLSLNADIKGEGTTWEVISQALTAQSDFNIADGRLTGESLAGGLATFLKTERLEVLDFDHLKGNVELKDGDFQIDTQFDSEDVRMAPEGTIGIDGDLALNLDLRVAPELASRIGSRDLVAQLEKTQDGWTILPIKLSGTLRSPKFDIDVSAITDRLKERGREELQKQLQDRVLDRFIPQKQEKEDSSDTSETKEKTPEKKVEDKLRRLLR